jgi:hypothetical protein
MDIGGSLTNNSRSAKSHQQPSQLENHGGFYATRVFIKYLLDDLKTIFSKKFRDRSNFRRTLFKLKEKMLI